MLLSRTLWHWPGVMRLGRAPAHKSIHCKCDELQWQGWVGGNLWTIWWIENACVLCLGAVVEGEYGQCQLRAPGWSLAENTGETHHTLLTRPASQRALCKTNIQHRQSTILLLIMRFKRAEEVNLGRIQHLNDAVWKWKALLRYPENTGVAVKTQHAAYKGVQLTQTQLKSWIKTMP